MGVTVCFVGVRQRWNVPSYLLSHSQQRKDETSKRHVIYMGVKVNLLECRPPSKSNIQHKNFSKVKYVHVQIQLAILLQSQDRALVKTDIELINSLLVKSRVAEQGNFIFTEVNVLLLLIRKVEIQQSQNLYTISFKL